MADEGGRIESKKKMGIGLSEIGVRIRGFVTSLSNHPFLVGPLCIFIFLAVFSRLTSASPLLICTPVLLGTLLYFRHPNLPPTRTEPRASNDAVVVDQSSRNGEMCCLNVVNVSKNKDIWEETVDAVKRNEPSDENSSSGSFDSKTATVNSPNFPHSPGGEAEVEDDVVSDSGLDDGESSSPDASIASVMPIIDELHPLLDEDSSNPIHISRMGSDMASEQSLRISTTSSCDSADDIIENHDEYEDDNEDEVEKEEELKSAIIWTEEDQKNLMDLGSSEIERNKWLENLILMRRRRKNLSMVPEINLIDLDGSNIFPPPHVGPILTVRRNPFDDSYDNSNIPGSAPSVLLQRRNPFESPCGPGPGQEWSWDAIGDGFQEGLTTFFKGNENLNGGPSVFADNAKMRPYFVPEHAIAKEPSFQSFKCQSSEMRDFKMSSVPETGSVGSVEDLEEEWKLLEEDVISLAVEVMEEDQSEDQDTIDGIKEFSEAEDVTQEPKLISEMNQVAEHICHESQSSFDDDEEESLEIGDMNITSISGDNNPHMGTIYDSSPPIFRKNFSSSSCGGSDMHGESHMTLPPVLVKRAVSLAERDSENPLIAKEVIAGSTEEKCLMVDGGESVTLPDSELDDYQEAFEKLVTTPAVGGSTSMFNDVAMHEPIFENLEEVQVPNTPVESNDKMQTIQNLNIPVIYELDHDTPSPSLGSPFSPANISMPSSTSLDMDMDMQTIQAVVDEIKEIDEVISSDLDSIGDFSATRSSLGSIQLEKHVMDSIGETNHMGYAIDLNGTERETILADPMDEIDVSNHDYQHNLSGRNEVDMDSVENVNSMGTAREKLIVDDGSLVKEVALNYDQVNSTQTSERERERERERFSRS